LLTATATTPAPEQLSYSAVSWEDGALYFLNTDYADEADWRDASFLESESSGSDLTSLLTATATAFVPEYPPVETSHRMCRELLFT
jgi:hypothetical protein